MFVAIYLDAVEVLVVLKALPQATQLLKTLQMVLDGLQESLRAISTWHDTPCVMG